MDMIVNRLSEIELAASRIMEAAALEKKDLEQQSQENIKAFDAKIDQETQEKLQKLKENLDAQMEQELLQLRRDTEKTIRKIESDYKANHQQLAWQLLQKMIEG